MSTGSQGAWSQFLGVRIIADAHRREMPVGGFRGFPGFLRPLGNEVEEISTENSWLEKNPGNPKTPLTGIWPRPEPAVLATKRVVLGTSDEGEAA
jgi:hypothetical protein